MKITPSTNLKCVTCHKLKDLVCWRKYYWRWIMNLESIKLNINFWYGGLLGAGFEAMIKGNDYKKAVRAEDRERCARHDTTGELENELRLQRDIMMLYLDRAKRLPIIKKMWIREFQEPFKVRLRDSGLWFCGTPDAIGTFDGDQCLFENKTAGRINDAYLQALLFDKQVNGYAYSVKLQKKEPLKRCCYCIFRKPQKRIKRGQTIDEFVEELRKDFRKRPEFYFIFHRFSLGVNTVADVGYDIESLATILRNRYEDLATDKNILDYRNWPKMEDKCFEFAGCEFLHLCKNPKKWVIYKKLYQQREMLYPIEHEELQHEVAR